MKEVGGSTQATKPRGEQQLGPCTRPGEEPGQQYEHGNHVIDAAWMHGEVDDDLEQEAAARRQVRIRGRLAYTLEPVERESKTVAAARSRKYHGGFSRRLLPSGGVVLTRRPARHAGEPAATVRHRMVQRKNWRGKHAALGVNKAKRKRRLGL